MSRAERPRRAAFAALCCAAAVLLAPAARADEPAVILVQHDRGFDRMAVTIDHGAILRFLNRDDFDHQIFVDAPNFSFESDEVAPGGSLDVRFPTPGHYQVRCHIHPKMALDVTVR